MSNVFLGGTCNGSGWRDEMIHYLEIEGVSYFNPIVDNWDSETYKKELQERRTCDFCLYVITPLMSGVYSIAEVIDDSNKRPEKTILVVKSEDNGNHFSLPLQKSLLAVMNMVLTNGGEVCDTLQGAAEYISKKLKEAGIY